MSTSMTPAMTPVTHHPWAPPGIPPDIAALTGPVFVGQVFNALLFGVLTVQVYIYYLSFPADRKLPKILVTVVYILEMVQLILSIHDGFRLFGGGWGDLMQLNNPGLLGLSVPILSCMISCTVQVFYAWRIWVLGSGLMWLPIFISVLALIQVAAGMWCGIATFVIADLALLQAKTHVPSSIWAGGTAFCDVIIAFSMLYFLSRSKSGFRHTNILLARIIRVTIETGLICAVFAIVDLTLFLAFESKNYYLTFAIALSKLYSNSLLVVLNSRMRIQGGRAMGSLTPDDYSLSVVLQSSGVHQYDSKLDPRATRVQAWKDNRLVPQSISISVSRLQETYEEEESMTTRSRDVRLQRSVSDIENLKMQSRPESASEISEVDRRTLDSSLRDDEISVPARAL